MSAPVRLYGSLTVGQWARVADKTERLKLGELLSTGPAQIDTGDTVADLLHERRWLRVRCALARLAAEDGGSTDGAQ